MLREWDAELEREFAGGEGWGAFVAAWGAFADASAARGLERERNGEGSMTIGARGAAWRRDLGLAARGLLRAPAFTAVAVITLAVGLGGAAAIYTLLDRVVFDPLPYPDADRLVRLENQVPGVGEDEVWALSTAQYVYLTDNSETLSEVGLYQSAGGNVLTPNGPQRARLLVATASTMELLGAEAHLGRVIAPDDDRPGAPVTVVLSHGFWTRALGEDPDIVGRSIPFNNVPMEVLGVLEPDVQLPGFAPSAEPDIWMPMRIDPARGFNNNHVYGGIAKLAPGASLETVQAELDRIQPRLPEVFPNVYSERFFSQYGFRTVATPLKESVVGELASILWVLFGGIALVLVIAAANVANLFLVRIEGKRREIDIRTALGAGRATIARYLLSEALALAAVGGVLALAVGFWGVPALSTIAPEELPRVQGVGMGLGTVGFTALLALGVGVAIAALPVLALPGRLTFLGEAGRSHTAGPGRGRARSALVVGQMAIAVALVVGAGTLVRSLRSLRATDPGMDPDGAISVSLYMNPHTYAADGDLWVAYEEILRGISELPGVASVGMGEEIPVEGGYGCTVQGFEDRAVFDRIEAAGMTTCAGQIRVTPGYFEALGIPVLEGRALELRDHVQPSLGSVVVSRAAADRFWPGENAIGKGIGPSGRTGEPFYRVVGVVDDVAKRSDEGRPPLADEAIAVYYPTVHNPESTGNWGWWWPGNMTLVVRTDVESPLSLAPSVRAAVAAVDPEIPLGEFRALTDVVDEAMANIAFISLLLTIAAGVALSLAAVGLYGVVAYVVSKRTREIGMRLAIGAQPSAVVRSVVGGTLRMVGVGLVVGIPLAYLTGRVGRSVLVGVGPTEPEAFLSAVALLVAVAFAASWLPARRGARIDPATALREE